MSSGVVQRPSHCGRRSPGGDLVGQFRRKMPIHQRADGARRTPQLLFAALDGRSDLWGPAPNRTSLRAHPGGFIQFFDLVLCSCRAWRSTLGAMDGRGLGAGYLQLAGGVCGLESSGCRRLPSVQRSQ
jgi:hypothetical protein